MFPGYASLGGNEIINNARLATYMKAAGLPELQCGQCSSNFHLAVADDPYTTPEADDMIAGAIYEDDIDDNPYVDPTTGLIVTPMFAGCPWYDSAVPESKDFMGVAGLGVTGFSKTVHSRTPTPLISEGSMIGGLYRKHREISWSVLLVACSEKALSYGVTWLSSALRGSACNANCWGDSLCVFASCPDTSKKPSGCGTYGDDEIRYLYNVGVMDGPEVKQFRTLGPPGCQGSCGNTSAEHTHGRGKGAFTAEVEFTLVSGLPYIYRRPLQITHPSLPIDRMDQCTPFIIGGKATSSPIWFDPCGEIASNPTRDCVCKKYKNGSPECCKVKSCVGKDCGKNPHEETAPAFKKLDCRPVSNEFDDPTMTAVGCAQPKLPPQPGVPLNPCWNIKPYQAKRQIITVVPYKAPSWLEQVPVLTIFSGTGSKGLRRITVRWHANAAGYNCSRDLKDFLEPCGACAEVNITYMPPNATLVVDGRIHRAYMDYTANTYDDPNTAKNDKLPQLHSVSPNIYGHCGKQFEWPVSECGSGYCVEVFTEAAYTSADMKIKVEMYPREDAS